MSSFLATTLSDGILLTANHSATASSKRFKPSTPQLWVTRVTLRLGPEPDPGFVLVHHR